MKWRTITAAAMLVAGFACALRASQRSANPLPEIIANARPSVVRVVGVVDLPDGKGKAVVVLGTGFVTGTDGTFVTALHVVTGLPSGVIVVAIPSDRDSGDIVKDRALLIKDDRERDVAILRSEGLRGRRAFVIGSPRLQDGDQILVLGFPFGNPILTATQGIIAAQFEAPLRERTANTSQIKVNAAVNKGNSGGPLIHVPTGSVVGMIDAREGDISKNLRIAAETQAGADMCAGPICVVATMKQTINDLDRFLHVGIGYAVSAKHITPLIAAK